MRLWHTDHHRLGPEAGREVADQLAAGAVVAIPTETYYGLAAHWAHREAIERIQALKLREPGKPLLLLVGDVTMARRLCPAAPALLERLAGAFWPGPLTLVLPGPAGLHPALLGAAGGLAVRHSPHPVVGAVLDHLREPITGTSANRSGHDPARTVGAIRLSDHASLDGAIDDGPTRGGKPSTVLQLTSAGARLLRAGAVGEAEISRLLGSRLL